MKVIDAFLALMDFISQQLKLVLNVTKPVRFAQDLQMKIA